VNECMSEWVYAVGVCVCVPVRGRPGAIEGQVVGRVETKKIGCRSAAKRGRGVAWRSESPKRMMQAICKQ
jgi:hypothetical protein